MKIATSDWYDVIKAIPVYIVVISAVFALVGLVVLAGVFLLGVLPLLYAATGLLWLISLGHIDLVNPLLRFAGYVFDSVASVIRD